MKTRPRWNWRAAGVGLQLLVLPVHAEPYTPTSDDEVLERLPPGTRSADLRRRRDDLSTDAENLRDSIDMALSYAETARVEGDARYLGYAQSILTPWWHQASPPAGVLLVRARVRSALFEFDRALADLDAAITGDPDGAAARLARFEVLVARGDAAAAATAWSETRSLLSPLAVATGAARLARISGPSAEAYTALVQALEEARDADPGEAHAALVLAADFACQLGRNDDASRHYSRLAAAGRRDVERLAAQADFLRDAGRTDEVIRLLQAETANDGLSIRLLEAWATRPAADDEERSNRAMLANQVARRLEARRSRGDATVLPDELRWYVRSSPNPALAAERAKELWAVRRELRDARLVLEAARLAGDTAVSRPVIDWLERNHVRDVRLVPPDRARSSLP